MAQILYQHNVLGNTLFLYGASEMATYNNFEKEKKKSIINGTNLNLR